MTDRVSGPTIGDDGTELWDVVVIGSGPAGQKAAVQAAKAGKSVCVVERDKGVGGACVCIFRKKLEFGSQSES